MPSKTRTDLIGVSGIGSPLFTVCRQGAFLVARKNRGLPGLICYSLSESNLFNSFRTNFLVYSGHLLLPPSHSSIVLLGIPKRTDIFFCVSPAFNRASFISFIFFSPSPGYAAGAGLVGVVTFRQILTL